MLVRFWNLSQKMLVTGLNSDAQRVGNGKDCSAKDKSTPRFGTSLSAQDILVVQEPPRVGLFIH